MGGGGGGGRREQEIFAPRPKKALGGPACKRVFLTTIPLCTWQR